MRWEFLCVGYVYLFVRCMHGAFEVFMSCIYTTGRVGQSRNIWTVYDRIYGDFPAKVTVYAPYIYGSGQP